jgi:hypothetical protein
MLFGGTQVLHEYQGTLEAVNHTIQVDGYDEPGNLLFSLFRLTLVDDYDYDVRNGTSHYSTVKSTVRFFVLQGMKAVDPAMADIMIGCWLALSAIVMLNLFIALMSDTFQRSDSCHASSLATMLMIAKSQKKS